MPAVTYVTSSSSLNLTQPDEEKSKFSLSSSTKNFFEETDKELKEQLVKSDPDPLLVSKQNMLDSRATAGGQKSQAFNFSFQQKLNKGKSLGRNSKNWSGDERAS